MRTCRTRFRPPTGAATLLVVLSIFVTTSLVALFAARQQLLDQRMTANQIRATRAFEAAESGLDWALARLNASDRVDDACEQASATSTGSSFRGRYLPPDPGDGAFIPSGLDAACVLANDAPWSCRCASAGKAPPDPAIGARENGPGEVVAFRVAFLPSSQAGAVRVAAVGCTGAGKPCTWAADRTADAVARHESVYALLSTLPVPPAAAVTLRGNLDAGESPILLGTTGSAAAIRAGGAVSARDARPAWPGLDVRIVEQDASLAASSPERFFSSYFGAEPEAWASLPGVQRLNCPNECSRELEKAIQAADGGLPTVQIDGDLGLAGPLVLGSTERPVVLVATGAIRIEGDVLVHGVLYGASMRWSRTRGEAGVRGALLLAGDYAGDGSPRLVRDAAVLDKLRRGSGGFVRVDGAWRDF